MIQLPGAGCQTIPWPPRRFERSPDRRLWAAQSVSLHGAAGHERDWIGDVGWSTWEEINRLRLRPTAHVDNFGWPCYEGNAPPVGLRRREPEPVRATLQRRNAECTAPPIPYHHSEKFSRAKPARRGLRRSLVWPSMLQRGAYPPPTTARYSSPTTAATASGR